MALAGEDQRIKTIVTGMIIGVAVGAILVSAPLGALGTECFLGRLLVAGGLGNYSLPLLPTIAATTVIGAIVGAGIWWSK